MGLCIEFESSILRKCMLFSEVMVKKTKIASILTIFFLTLKCLLSNAKKSFPSFNENRFVEHLKLYFPKDLAQSFYARATVETDLDLAPKGTDDLTNVMFF